MRSRGVDRFKLAEFLPAEEACGAPPEGAWAAAPRPRLARLMDVLGRACNVSFRALPQSGWWTSGRGRRSLASVRLGSRSLARAPNATALRH